MMRTRLGAIGLLAMVLLVAACGSSEETPETSTDADTADTNASDTDETDTKDADIDLAETVATAPSITPGDVAEGQVVIDGTTIDYVTVTPEGFTRGDTAPLLLAMPPGGQTLDLTRSVTAGTYATEAIARGWVVVSPAAPNGELYFQGSEALVPGLMSWITTWVTPEGGKPHVAGISNGGISSFRLAALQPDGFHSILVFPGLPRSEEDRAALEQLTDVPIRMFVGETDTGWVTPMEEAFATLTDLGGDVTYEVRTGEGHVMRSLSDGVDVFDELDALRQQ